MLAALTEAGFVLDARTLHAPDLAEPIRRRLDVEAAALAPCGAARRRPTPSAPRPGARRGVADTLRRRLAAQVLITGASHLAVPIAAILASAGVGHLDPDLRGVTRLADAAPAGLLPTDAAPAARDRRGRGGPAGRPRRRPGPARPPRRDLRGAGRVRGAGHAHRARPTAPGGWRTWRWPCATARSWSARWSGPAAAPA